jgi:MerR family transcriptional regulator, light-induced transcriptional regulator
LREVTVAGQQHQYRSREVPSGSARAATAALSTIHRLAASTVAVDPTAPPSPELTAFVEALSATEELVAAQFVTGRLDAGVPADALVLDLLAPAAREVGRRWEEDECDFVTVTLALGRLQRILRSLAARLAASGASIGPIPGTICIACLPDEQHTFGASVCAEFFARDGWQVVMGAPLSRSDTVELVRRAHTDVVALSVSRSTAFPAVARMVSRLRRASKNRHLTIFIGGPMAPHIAELPDRLGADAVITDLGEAVRLARVYAADRAPAPRPQSRDVARLR